MTNVSVTYFFLVHVESSAVVDFNFRQVTLCVFVTPKMHVCV